jgi:hypothetical protein
VQRPLLIRYPFGLYFRERYRIVKLSFRISLYFSMIYTHDYLYIIFAPIKFWKDPCRRANQRFRSETASLLGSRRGQGPGPARATSHAFKLTHYRRPRPIPAAQRT